jgi:hypothetical protein
MLPTLKVVNDVELHYVHPDGSTSLAATMHVRDESHRAGAIQLGRWIAQATGNFPTPSPVPKLHGPDGDNCLSEHVDIVVNGMHRIIPRSVHQVTYTSFIKMLGMTGQPTVIYQRGQFPGTFIPGQMLDIEDGMRFEVCDTSNA